MPRIRDIQPSKAAVSETFLPQDHQNPRDEHRFTIELREKSKPKAAFLDLLSTVNPYHAERFWDTLDLGKGQAARLLKDGEVVAYKARDSHKSFH